jgi:hypothetical protein
LVRIGTQIDGVIEQRWGEYSNLGEIKWLQAAENCIIISFIICTLNEILLEWSNRAK